MMSGEGFASEERLLVDGAHPDDPRVLRGGGFLSSLPPPRVQLRSQLTLHELVRLVSEQMFVSVDEIKSRSKSQKLSKVCAEIARQAVRGRIATLHEVAHFMGRHPSSLCRLLERRVGM